MLCETSILPNLSKHLLKVAVKSIFFYNFNLGLLCEDSALFRHEVAYVLGQVQSAVAIPELRSRLCKADESCMVRHECAEALGAIGTPECEALLKEYAKDNEVCY